MTAVAISPCVGCGEHAEPIDTADLSLGLVIDHRGGCLAAPERPTHTCLYLDGDVVEATGADCGACVQDEGK